MSHVLTPEFETVLLHDILPAPVKPLPANQGLDLNVEYPNKVRLLSNHEKVVNVNTILPDEEDRALVAIPGDSQSIRALHPDPSLHRKRIHVSLRDECGLDPENDFAVMGIYPQRESGLIVGAADQFLLSINQDNFNGLAMDMLRKLADPRLGADLAHDGDKDHYRHDLDSPQSEPSKLVTHILMNAKPSVDDLDELRHLAARKGNFGFCTRLMECGDLLYPGFSAARTRHAKPQGSTGGLSL
jgi:hypothetical protein